MKDFFNGIIRANGEQWFGFFIFSFVLSILILMIIALSADHKIQCYYAKSQMTNAGIAYMIYGDVNWSEDIISYSFSDSAIALKTIINLNQCGDKK